MIKPSLTFDFHPTLRPDEAYPIGGTVTRRTTLAMDVAIETPKETTMPDTNKSLTALAKSLSKEDWAQLQIELGGVEDDSDADENAAVAVDGAPRLRLRYKPASPAEIAARTRDFPHHDRLIA